MTRTKPPLAKIVITLPANRWNDGTLTALDDAGKVLLECPARGKADGKLAAAAGNPLRDPTRRNGDTPTGGYAPTAVRRFEKRDVKFGWGFIPLDPVSGAALAAEKNGRRGLGIHGGRSQDKLTATEGCVRVFDRDFLALSELAGTRTFSVEIRADTAAVMGVAA